MMDKGVQDSRILPCDDFNALWDGIFVPSQIKERLLGQALLSFTLRAKVNRSRVPIHGIILLVGPPGTGKTSLAKGLASKVASHLKGHKVHYIEVEPHTLTSSALGKSQREVLKFFQQTVEEQVSHGPLIVLLDEVETIASSRAKMSLEANPIDVHRATDAVLASLDALAAKHPHLLFIATSNFEAAIDDAFVSRTDLVERIDIPDESTCLAIISDTVQEIGSHWSKVKKLPKEASFDDLGKLAVGLDGRKIRKAIIQALAYDTKLARDPNLLEVKHIELALNQIRGENT